MSFNKLSKDELLRTLEEDFAFALTPEEQVNKQSILAAIAEGKLSFTDYLKANPDQAEKFAPKPTVAPSVPTEVEVNGVVVSGEPEPTGKPRLMKMDRKNPYFEVGQYTFTATHPYALVAEHDVDKVVAEGGFREATPTELSEYYG